MITWVHPALLFIAGAFILPFVPSKGRLYLLLGLPLAAFCLFWIASEGSYGDTLLLGEALTPIRIDPLSRIFGFAFSMAVFLGMLYALSLKGVKQHVAALLYAGSAMGAVLAGDLLSFFLFWEAMAFTSVFLIWWGDTKNSATAGMRYLLMHIIGGAVLLGGIVLHAGEGGGLAFEAMGTDRSLGTGLILMGILLNAAAPPLHVWLTDAYPEGSVTGTVFLSAFTTKVAIYALIRGFAGHSLLLPLGLFMAVYGTVYALFQDDIRRLLAYSMIGQIGIMISGIGMGDDLATGGAVAHAFASIFYTGLLFMVTGAIIEATGRRRLTELGGLYKVMPVTCLLYLVGGLSIGGAPLLSGFVSKAMILSAAHEAHHPIAVGLLTLASAVAFLHTGLRLPYYLFFGPRDHKMEPAAPINGNRRLAMYSSAAICFLIGLVPNLLYRLLPVTVSYHPYTMGHILESLLILLVVAALFFPLRAVLAPRATALPDIDGFYQRCGQGVMWLADHPIARWEAAIVELHKTVVIGPSIRWVAHCRWFDTTIIDGMVNGIGRLVFSGGAVSTWIEKYIIYGAVNVIGHANHVASALFRLLQTGTVHHYATLIIAGAFALVHVYLLFYAQ